MTQKEALRQLEKYCEANNMHLTYSSFTPNTLAIVTYEGKPTGNSIIENNRPCHRISGYHKPTELLIWLDGYHAGVQKSGKQIQEEKK